MGLDWGGRRQNRRVQCRRMCTEPIDTKQMRIGSGRRRYRLSRSKAWRGRKLYDEAMGLAHGGRRPGHAAARKFGKAAQACQSKGRKPHTPHSTPRIVVKLVGIRLAGIGLVGRSAGI